MRETPKHRAHRYFGRDLGLDSKTLRQIDSFLDFPEVAGIALPHKAFHNLLVLPEVQRRYGDKGVQYALRHMVLDRVNEADAKARMLLLLLALK